MRVLIFGSRKWMDKYTIHSIMIDTFTEMWSVNPEDTITWVHGAAPGADTLGESIALDYGLGNIESHPADWNTWGKRAGPIRNAEMIDSGLDYALGFIVNGGAFSRGSEDMLRRLRTAGVPGKVVRVTTEDI